MNAVALFVMLAPVYLILCLISYVVYRLSGRVEKLWDRCDAIETVDDGFTGQIQWPIEPDAWLLDGLRAEAGDEDDTKRKQFDAVVRLTEQRH